MPPPPRKRLRRLASIEGEDEGELELEEEEVVVVVEESDLDEIVDGDSAEEEDEKVGVGRITRRATGSLRGNGMALEGRRTNDDDDGDGNDDHVTGTVIKRRSTRIKKGGGAKGRGKGAEKRAGKRAGNVEDDGVENSGWKRRKNNTNTNKKETTMPTLDLQIDRSRREGSSTSTSTSTSSQSLTMVGRNHKPIASLFGGRGITASASAFSGSTQGARPFSLPLSNAATAKLIVPKQTTTLTSKQVISSQSVVLEDLDDLIQDWNSDGISDDEAEILAAIGTKVAVKNNRTGVIVKKEIVIGGPSTQPTQSQPLPKRFPPIFRTPQILQTPLQVIERRGPDLPWAQKYTPTNSAGLAIHKKKVEDVSQWLLRVRQGTSRKRVLILKGPTGCGKTATLEALAREGGWHIVEWGSPTGGGGGAVSGSDDDDGWKFAGGESFASAFEDWLFRGDRKLLLLEDLPNLSHPGTLLSFRTAIRSYLSLPSPPTNSNNPPIPPLILIVSEVSEGAGSSTTMGMSVHKMLGSQILSHPLISEIQFRKVARTLLVKCLEEVVRKEGYGGIFGKDVLDSLSEQGDLRGAIGGLEMLALGRDKQSVFGKAGGAAKSIKRKRTITAATVGKILNFLHPRLSTLGIFHSIGKVVYNKRYGDDPSDPYSPPPPKPPPELREIHRYHPRTMKLDPNTILDESGVDAGMFVYGVQENYLGSFHNAKKTLEDVLEAVCFCAEGLSEADLLLGGGFFSEDLGGGISRINAGAGGGGYTSEGGEGVLRQEDIAAQVVVRSMALGLPSPVKRDSSAGNGYSKGPFGQSRNGSGAWKGGAQMYYPMGLRLWRDKEEIESVVEVWEGRVRDGRGLGGSVGARDGEMMPVMGLTKGELVLERLPYMAKIARGKITATCTSTGAAKWGNGFQQRITKTQPAASATTTTKASQGIIRSLEQATAFRGVRVQPTTSEPDPEPENDEEEEGGGLASSLFDLDEDENDKALMPPPPAPYKGFASGNEGRGGNLREDIGSLGEEVGGLVLMEDDIVDDW